MSDKAINHGFTPEQSAWLAAQFSVAQSNTGFDKATTKWMIGGLTALGLAATAFLWSEVGSVREELRNEIGSVRAELRNEIGSVRMEVRENRAAIAELAKGQARIEAILNERLPRPE